MDNILIPRRSPNKYTVETHREGPKYKNTLAQISLKTQLSSGRTIQLPTVQLLDLMTFTSLQKQVKEINSSLEKDNTLLEKKWHQKHKFSLTLLIDSLYSSIITLLCFCPNFLFPGCRMLRKRMGFVITKTLTTTQ